MRAHDILDILDLACANEGHSLMLDEVVSDHQRSDVDIREIFRAEIEPSQGDMHEYLPMTFAPPLRRIVVGVSDRCIVPVRNEEQLPTEDALKHADDVDKRLGRIPDARY